MAQNPDALRIKFHSGGWASLPAGSTFGPRKLPDYEFLWILEGNCRGQLDDFRFDLQPGSVVLARDAMIDYYEWDRTRTTRALYVHFRIEHGFGAFPPKQTWPVVRLMPEGDIIRPMLRHLMWLLDQRQPEHRALAQSVMRHLLMAYISGAVHTSAETARDLPAPVHRTFRFIQEKIASGMVEAPTLPEMAKAALCSEGHLCRLFRQTVGCGPMQALRMMRLDHASTLLAGSNLKIQDVSTAAGFENAFHFSRCFREAFKMSPREYRKKAATREVTPHSRLMVIRTLAGPF
ncbi:MAG TPA: AraC family transcriptional regulator [Planctomycetota bacterium]|nr:AraC family transcriptional regulator [Planctomycetota bacterium]